MKTVGIVCEYNPLHRGHASQFRRIREKFGDDAAIVCAMSGQYVQRGAPALIDKSLRAAAAVRCGASLAVELPVTVSLSSAEGFAAGGVSILARLCDTLCFGTESADRETCLLAAHALLRPDFSPLLKEELETGKSFPAARQAALERLGMPFLSAPNDLLAVEYTKAVIRQGLPMELFPIRREGDYHSQALIPSAPSATALRKAMLSGGPWRAAVPEEAIPDLEGAALHTLAAGERAILGRLRTMTDGEFESLPYGSEGLWRKLMKESRRLPSLEDILTAVKSKRYTRTRLDRMVLCAFLGLTQEDLTRPAPYVRILAFDDTGRALLKSAKEEGFFRNAGAPGEGAYWELEKRCGDLYGLFCVSAPEPPGAEQRRRVRYIHRSCAQPPERYKI